MKKMDPEKHGPWETWNKYGIKNTTAFTEFNKENAQCDLQFSKTCVLTLISKQNFSG